MAGRLARPAAGILPSQFQAMLSLLPNELPAAEPLPEFYPAQGRQRARVALLAGCVQQALAPEINWATLRVLARNGVEVIIPKGQVCCGGLALHTGDQSSARLLATTNLRMFTTDVDAIITTAAGCGSSLHEYPLLLQETEWAEAAEIFSAKAVDVSVFLDQLGIESPPALPQSLKIAYHDACHLAHAQKVTVPPRNILNQIQGLTILPVPESDFCCGSAGSYSLEQPEIAGRLGDRKARHILSTGAQVVVTGNIGCLVQIRTYLNQIISTNGGAQTKIPVMHTIELIDRAYAGWSYSED
jgi:glycolate oxidase iron-sulfur subunit